jgi:opacity protein-like surface antigen
MSRLLVAAIVVMSMVFVMPAFSADTEINIGGGHPLWGTHTDNDDNGFDGGDSWLFFASVDKKKKDSKWLSYGLMYNYTRVKMNVYKEETKWRYEKYDTDFRECDGDCQPIPNPSITTTSTDNYWLSVHVLGPYAKPHFKIGNRVSVFGTVGAGLMYVDGKIYGDEFGGAGFASAGLSVDIYKNFGIAGQMLYVKGFTKHVEDIDYYAPVLSLNYRF